MSTTKLDNWAVDLANVDVIYPFVGFEGLMAAIGIALWLIWHIWHARWETREYNAEIERFGDADTVKQAIEADIHD